MSQEYLASKYIFGIPTRVDVKNPGYAKAVRAEELNQQIWDAHWPTSTIALHNHVVTALRAGGEDVFLAEGIYRSGRHRSGLFARLKREDPGHFIDPRLVLDIQINSVNQYQQALHEAETYHLEQTDYSGSWMQTNTKVEPLPKGVVEKALAPGEGRNSEMSWAYSFNPWELAAEELGSLKADLEALRGQKGDPFRQIHRIWSVVNTHHDSPAKRLTGMMLRVPVDRSTFSYEHDTGTKAGRLYKLNAEIAAVSDIAVNFDTLYLSIQSGRGRRAMVPFNALWNPDERNSRNGIQMRAGARDDISKKLHEGETVVINGTTLYSQGAKLRAVNRLPDWFINLVGEPVEVVDHPQIPEEWTRKEVALLDEYRSLPLDKALATPYHPTVKKILAQYTGFVEPGFRTDPKEVAEDIVYALRQADCLRLHPATQISFV